MSKDKDRQQEQGPDGVQRLIDRIREEAVAAGRSEADAILEQARSEAAALLEAATRERDELQRKARGEIEIERQAAQAAVHTAARDVILGLKAGLVATFEAHVARLVQESLLDPELMRALVLTLAGRVAKEVLVDQRIEVVVSTLLAEHNPSQPMPPGIRDRILGISRDMLREGVELKASPRVAAGAKVHIVGEALEVDLSDQAISEMLLAYLTPRFRWILEGVE